MMSNKIILGTVQFGLDYGINNEIGKPSTEQVFEMLEYAEQHGINILDTADAYGNATELLGKFNRSHPDTYSINTKFKNNELLIRDQLINALESLQTNKVNTFFYHSFRDFQTNPELLSELTNLKLEGLFRKIGLSVYDNEEFEKAIKAEEIDVIQLPFNLLDNYTKRGELLKQAKANGKEIHVRSVFLQGLFFKPLNMLPSKLSKLRPYLEKIESIAQKFDYSFEQLALGYVIQQPEIDYVIIGVDNLIQLKRNLKIANEKINGEAIKMIDSITVSEVELLYPKNWN